MAYLGLISGGGIATVRIPASLFVSLIALGALVAHAQEAVPTEFPGPGQAALVVYVVNDLNANGKQDPGEPGLEGWQVYQACSDVLLGLGQTDADGELIAIVRASEPCFLLDVPYGWLVTGGNSRTIEIKPGSTSGLVFLVHHVGSNAQNFGGNVFVNGLAAPSGTTVDALFEGNDCGAPEVVLASFVTRYSMYVLGESDRPGCPAPGEQFSLTVNGVAVASATFSPLMFATLDLFLGPQSMYFYLLAPNGSTPIPYVGSMQCGESHPVLGPLNPENFHVVYVLPNALRAGCGAPGRTVTVKAGGLIIQQVAWRVGYLPTIDVPPFTPVPDITLPGTGRTSGDGSDRTLPAAVAVAGVLLLAGGLFARRELSG